MLRCSKDLQIGGLNPFTTIDYPGKLSCVLFLSGCPWRCRYCSNPDLLELKLGVWDADKILGFLSERRGKLEAVVFSGGEALMQGDALVPYAKKIKEMGFLIGLHTNGFYPEKLSEFLPVADWVGLDFKATRANYAALTGNAAAAERAEESLDLLLKWGGDYECRTTADPRFISKQDLLRIANYLSEKGVKNYAVQKYTPHFEAADEPTTESERAQFFNDPQLRLQLDGLFEKVVWRE